MARKYTVSDKVKAAQVERARKGAAAIHSPAGLITRIERVSDKLTAEDITRLSALVTSAKGGDSE